MGLSLRNLGRNIVDLFSADTEEDQRKRMDAKQPRFYADQQRQMGNTRPETNPFSRVSGAIYRNAIRPTVNIGSNALTDIAYDIPRYAFGGSESDFNKNTVFGQFTQPFRDNPNDFAKGFRQSAGRTLSGTLDAAAFVPLGGGVKAVKAGTPLLRQAVTGARIASREAGRFGLGYGTATTLQEDNPTLKSAAVNIGGGYLGGRAVGAVAGAAAPLVAAGGKRIAADLAGNEAGFLGRDAQLSELYRKTNESIRLRQAPGVTKTQVKNYNKNIKSLTKQINKRKEQISQGGYIGNEQIPKKVSLKPRVTVKQSGLGTQIKTALIEKDQPIVRTLRQVEKQTGKKGVVDQFMYDSGLQSRSASIANQKLTSNANLKGALKGLKKKELRELNAYAAARSELSNASKGLKTSAPVADLQKVAGSLDSKYRARFEGLNKFYKDLAKDLRDGGVIDEARYQSFISSPDYVRVQRDMSDLVNMQGRGGNAYSLGSSITRFKRTGSGRAIQGADATAFDYAQNIQKEIQRNQTAGNLAKVLNESGLAKELKPSEAVRKNTLKYMDNGKVRVFEVEPEIKEAVDNIAPYQLNTLEKIIAYPKRIFQAGTTGLSAPFTLANWVKDQVGSGINSKSIIDTHNPANIMSGIWQASKDFGSNNDAMWQKFIAHAGDTTQFDLTRATKSSVKLSRELRRGGLGIARNKITSPIRSLEDFVSITEKATRFQNFKGIYNDVLKKTGNETDALREATLAAWQNSVDFNRYGNWGKTLNLLIPYLNSGIQGSRQLVRSFKNRPLATSAKSIAMVGMPIAGVTAWNLQDPERKAVYDNISEFEKENNLIIIPPGQLSQNEDGTYNVWKLPLTQGYSRLFGGLRRSMESYANKEPNDFLAIAEDVIGAVSGPIDPDVQNPIKMGSSLIPQAAKPLAQQAANQDFFTGKEIVPEYVDKATDAQGNPISESQKAFDYSSGSARILGSTLNQSPIRVEKFFKDTFGKVGQYGENAIDNGLVRLGIISPEQIGGISVKDDITRRFTKAQSEYNYQKSEGGKYYDKVAAATAGLNTNEQAGYDAIHPSKTNFLGEDILDENKRLSNYAKAGIYLQFPKVFAADKAINDELAKEGKPSNPLFALPQDQATRVLLKQALPPGATDPELSNLWKEEWYQDFNTNRSKYYDQVKQSLAAQGKSLPKSDNPYPETPDNLQSVMDTYSALPKDTGARSAWIRANGELWERMKNQWSKVDAWENKERVKIGLKPIKKDDEDSRFASRGGGGSRSISVATPFSSGRGTIRKATFKKAYAIKNKKYKASKPKVSIKKSLV